jgi:hypothetical protein|tara:strand:- start:520 stop:2409 length:1890 start_codon:yes stop_codon:yes gene_type:complete
MPLVDMPFTPGVDKQDTPTGAEGRWIDSDNIRFRYGLPEKIGGWEKVTSDALVGAARGIHAWSSLDGSPYTSIGTNKKLYVYVDSEWADITPIRASGTGNITNFTTIDTSTNVVVHDATHGAREGDFVTISGVSGTVNGIVAANLEGEFEITALGDTASPPTDQTNKYQITAKAAATSTGAAGETANAAYQINTDPPVSTAGYGWGAGTWGASTWGTSRAGLTGVEAVQLDSGKWSLDNWGEDMIAQQLNGGLYYWDTSVGTGTRATSTTVSAAPTKSLFTIVSGTDRHVVCFGTETTIGSTGTQDNMFIRWCDQENVNDWTPSTTNTAGSQRLTDGSSLISAKRSRGAVLIWSDTAMYQMQLVGAPFTFGFSQLGANCGAAGLNSTIDVNGTSFWMGKDSFFMFDGSVQKLRCAVEDYVFKDISEGSQRDTFAANNGEFNEVTWFYPSSGSSVINRCVTYNYADQVWYVGTLNRSSWIDKGIYSYPYATTYDSSDTTATISTITGLTAGRAYMYSQEFGSNAEGAAITAYVESGDFVIPQAGEYLMSIKRFIPDFKNLTGTVNVTLKFRDYPTSTQNTIGPFAVTTSTTKVDTRARGRQGALRVESSAIDDAWRFGTYRAEIRQDGRR